MTTIASTSSTASASGSTSQSATSRAALAQNMDTFLKLLTTQLSHQDPLSPMDSSQFTSQLVQYASVEQQINTNSNLEKMLSTSNSTSMASAVSYLGTTVTGVSTGLPLQDGAAKFSYTTPSNATKMTAVIADSSGNIVRALSVPATSGTQTVSWDGKDYNGKMLSDGAYKLTLNASLNDGSTQDVDTSVWGKVTSMGMDSSNAVQLFMGSVNLPLANVIKVENSATTSGSSSSSSSSSNSNS